VSPLFDDLDGRENLRRNEVQNRSARRNEWRDRRRQRKREGIDRPDGIVIIVVSGRDLWSSPFRRVHVNAVKMSVDNGAMIVIRALAARMHVLKWGHKERQQQSKARL